MNFDNSLQNINGDFNLDFTEHYNRVYRDYELNDDPYFGVNINCVYYDIPSLSASIKGPIYLSINIQSLMSKHESLVQFLHELSVAKISVDVIAYRKYGTFDIMNYRS